MLQENIKGTSQFTETKLSFSCDIYCNKYNLVPLTYSISSSKRKSKIQIPTPQSQGRPSQQQLDFVYNMLSSTVSMNLRVLILAVY